MFLLLTTQKRLHHSWNSNGDEDLKRWSLKYALADGTNAAVEKYRAPRHSLVAALQETTPIALCQERGWRADRRAAKQDPPGKEKPAPSARRCDCAISAGR